MGRLAAVRGRGWPAPPGRPTPGSGHSPQIPGGHFGMLVKPALPVWRPRPLFANRMTFMTTFAEPAHSATIPTDCCAIAAGDDCQRAQCPAGRSSAASTGESAPPRGPRPRCGRQRTLAGNAEPLPAVTRRAFRRLVSAGAKVPEAGGRTAALPGIRRLAEMDGPPLRLRSISS